MDTQGHIRLDELEAAMNEDTILVSMMGVAEQRVGNDSGSEGDWQND